MNFNRVAGIAAAAVAPLLVAQSLAASAGALSLALRAPGDGAFSSQSFVWRVSSHRYIAATPQSQAEIRAELRSIARGPLAKMSPGRAARFRKAWADSDLETDLAHDERISATVKIGRHDGKSLWETDYTGSYTHPGELLRGSFLDYFDGRLGVWADLEDDSRPVGSSRWLTGGPNGCAWDSAGQSLYFDGPLGMGGRLPYHCGLICLAQCSNILLLHGITWRLQSVTRTTYTLVGDIPASQVRSARIRVVLDRTHGLLPFAVDEAPVVRTVPGQGTHIRYRITAFAKSRGAWMPAAFTYSADHGRLGWSRQSWRLIGTGSCAAVKLTMPHSVQMTDFRLLPAGVTWLGANTAYRVEPDAIVSYSWPGRILTRADLESIRRFGHPEVARSQALLVILALAGVALCAIGAAIARTALRPRRP